MKRGSNIKVFAFFLVIAILTTATLAWARPYRSRVHDAKVNTSIERSFDKNRDGWIEPRERAHMAHRRVNTAKEYRCDFNHNGWIDTPGERTCRI